MDPLRLSFERDRVELSRLDFGGDGPLVILLHGLAGHAGEWSQTAGWLIRDHRVIALDERGHGHSTRVPEDVSPQANVADVVHLLGELGLGPATLVGQSLGANLAFLVAARHPGLVRGLIVAEGCPEADPEGEGVEAIRGWLGRWPVPFPSREAALAFFGGSSLYREAWADGLEPRPDGLWPRFEIEVMASTLRQATAVERWHEWEAIRCPTLAVRAGKGFFTCELFEKMASRLRGCRHAEIPGARHDLHLDRPSEWREQIEPFLASLDPGRAGAA